jgi:GWxTD domain-containing protein
MRRAVVIALLLALAIPPAIAQKKPDLPPRYKTWLDQEVVYIIAAKERSVFLQLRTDKERDIFVEAFWKQRDPTVGTPRNEFQEEHYRRFHYANSYYGRSNPLPGWRTDRGRIYIILGPPRNIEQYDSVNGVYPTEIWFYLGDPDLGLPTAFNVIFFKREGAGDYVLYSPTEHGPRALIAGSMGGYRDVTRTAAAMTNDQAAYKELKELEPNLAPQVLSLIPGESVQPGYESLASNRLMANVFNAPQKKVEVDYAEAILKYKDFVEVEYTANYVGSEVEAQVIRDGTGASLVHYTIEPARISAEEAGGKYEVRFRLTGRVSDAAGKTVTQFDKDFPFSLTGAELEDVRAKSISIQDAFPLVPGSYNFDILLKNLASKEFTGAGRTVVVPDPAGPPGLGTLLLAYGVETAPAGSRERVPFRVGDAQLLAQTRKIFGTKDALVLFFQPCGLTPELKASGTLRTEFLREDREVLTRTGRLADVPPTGVVDVQSLKDFPPGYYQVRVTLLDGQGKAMASAKENFEVSLAPAVPRPLVMAKIAVTAAGEDELLNAGIQLANKGDVAAALPKLAEAHAAAPERPDVAVAYAQVLFRSGDHRRTKDVLLPWAEKEDAPAEVPALLGQACHALGEFEAAAKYYTAYLVRFGANVDILNWLGTCHFQLGNREEALRAWTKSLEISPNQEKIKALVDSLKKK